MSGQLVPGRVIGLRLCELFGLDPDTVTGMTVTVVANKPVEVTVTKELTRKQVDGLLETLARYNLVPVQPSP